MTHVVEYDPELRLVVDFGHHLSLIPLENDADPAAPYVSLLELPDEKDVRGSGRLGRFEYSLGRGGVNLGEFKWTPEEQSDLYFSFHHYLGYSHATHLWSVVPVAEDPSTRTRNTHSVLECSGDLGTLVPAPGGIPIRGARGPRELVSGAWKGK